nr:hypothetical protein [Bacteroidales bacterium]
DLDSSKKHIAYLSKNYPVFFELYNTKIINIGSTTNKAYSEYLIAFLTDYTINNIHNKTLEKIPDVEFLNKKLTKNFKRYKYYFPNKTIPAVYTFTGGFNQSIVIGDSLLAIGTDKYLGGNCEYYTRLKIPNYKKKNMHYKKIPSDCINAWITTEFVYNDSIDNLTNNIIYKGKIQYLLDALMPDEPDTLKFGFTSQELKWCKQNEKEMWNYLIENKLLFTTDYMTINKFINPAPFTAGFPQDSPGKAIEWLGREIIYAYMKRNSDISISELMKEDNYQKILTESRYQP